jgi:SAM-dependent methyltransferase
MTRTRILDACCGSRMFWYDRDNKYTVYQDNRELDTTLCDGRKLEITPGLFGDFRKMIYADNYFDLVVFDPPHLVRAGKTSWLAQKYGVLDGNWKADIKAGFAECFRVLRPFGTLVFKWNTEQIPFSEVIKLAPEQPLFGDKRVNTRWVVFCKGARASDRVTD